MVILNAIDVANVALKTAVSTIQHPSPSLATLPMSPAQANRVL
jgi:hypothetical protein